MERKDIIIEECKKYGDLISFFGEWLYVFRHPPGIQTHRSLTRLALHKYICIYNLVQYNLVHANSLQENSNRIKHSCKSS